MSSLSFFGEILSLKKNLTHQMSMPPNSFSTNSFKRHEYFISKSFLKKGEKAFYLIPGEIWTSQQHKKQ